MCAHKKISDLDDKSRPDLAINFKGCLFGVRNAASVVQTRPPYSTGKRKAVPLKRPVDAGQSPGGTGRFDAGAVPIGAPQKTIGTPLNTGAGTGQGGPPKFAGNCGRGVARLILTKFAKSIKQFGAGRMMRIGVKPGQTTKFSIKLVSTPNCDRCGPRTQANESENCTRLSCVASNVPKLWPKRRVFGISRLGSPVTPGKL